MQSPADMKLAKSVDHRKRLSNRHQIKKQRRSQILKAFHHHSAVPQQRLEIAVKGLRRVQMESVGSMADSGVKAVLKTGQADKKLVELKEMLFKSNSLTKQ